MEEKLNSLVPAAIAFVLAAVIAVVGIYVVTSLPGSGGSLGTITTAATQTYSQVNSSGTYTTTYKPQDTGSFALKTGAGVAIPYYSLNATAGTFRVNASYTTTNQTANLTSGVAFALSRTPAGYPWNATGHNVYNSSGSDFTANATFNVTAGTVTMDQNMTNAIVSYVTDSGTTGAVATYTYQGTTTQSNASVNTTNGLSTFVNMLPLLALGVAAAVVIALLAGYLGKKDSL